MEELVEGWCSQISSYHYQTEVAVSARDGPRGALAMANPGPDGSQREGEGQAGGGRRSPGWIRVEKAFQGGQESWEKSTTWRERMEVRLSCGRRRWSLIID